jgi:hypothetical protein
MGIGDRHSARHREQSDQIATLTQPQLQAPDDDDELIFETATPPVPAKLPVESLRSRTATRHDPLTTELLAEVSRRTNTIDVSPDMVEEAEQSGEHQRKPAVISRKR